MPTPTAQQIILDRYRDKCRAAGGPRVGFVLRRRALLYHRSDHPDLDLGGGIDALVDSGMLKSSESGDFLFLSADGVEALGQTLDAPA